MDIPRTRTDGNLTGTAFLSFKSNQTSCSDATPRVDNYYIGSLGRLKSTTDWVTPGFFRRRAKGEVFFKTYSSLTTTKVNSGSSHVVMTKTFPGCGTNPWIYERIGAVLYHVATTATLTYAGQSVLPVATSLFSNTEIERLTAEIQTKCMADRQKGEANFLESLAELDQAWALLTNPLSNLSKFLDSFMRNHRPKGRYKVTQKSGVPFIDFASSEYLRFRYGVQPLVNDCKAALKALQKAYDAKPKRYTSRATGYIVRNSYQEPTWSGGQFAMDIGVTRTHLHRVRAMWLDEYRNDAFIELGLTFRNLMGLALELTRYSFVLEWFVNLGDLLYANVPRVSVTPLGGMVWHLDDKSSLFYCKDLKDDGGYAVTGNVSDTYVLRDEHRYRQQNSGASELVLKHNFGFDNWTRCADALALLQQLLGRMTFG